jgi:hypothetical protein
MAFGLLILAGACLEPARATMTQICNWNADQVMMMPVVMDFHSPPSGTSQIAFISFHNNSAHSGGVLRIIDDQCAQVAQFPDPNCTVPIPPSCPAGLNLAVNPHLEPSSGLAAGRLDNATTDVDIVGVLDTNKQIIDFTLVNGCLRPKWCSQVLGPGNLIGGTSAPAIAQLDNPNLPQAQQNEIVIDNKVFNFNGSLRYGGAAPRSRTAIVTTRLPSSTLPVVITGRGLYRSSSPNVWTGSLAWQNASVTSSALVYPAVAELDATSPGPEIVVTDTLATRLRVLSSAGAQLASAALPNPGASNCGGPPMIGNIGFPVIGVASCTRYTLYRYSPGVLTQLWTQPISDPSGQTTSTFYVTPIGNLIYYGDAFNLRIFNAANGAVLQTLPNTSATALEGPVIASLKAAQPLSRVIVAATDYQGGGGQRGIRIFSDPWLGVTRGTWNQHTYHLTNVTSSSGNIPVLEVPNWINANHNTYRVQWP